MDLATIRKRLEQYSPPSVDHDGCLRAAVAMILRERHGECEALLIQRTERPDDPWSGQMALPGGREQPSDGDLTRTAVREAHEEVGIDLTERGQMLGRLDDVQPMAGDQPVGLIIRPYVYALAEEIQVRPNEHEVHDTVWLPLSFLNQSEASGVYVWHVDGSALEFPAFIYRGYAVWGLTYRMLTGFLSLMR